MGDSRQSAPKSLREPAGKGSGWLVLALVFTLLQGVCFFLSRFTRNQKTKPPIGNSEIPFQQDAHGARGNRAVYFVKF